MTTTNPLVVLPAFCRHCRYRLVVEALAIPPEGPWRACVIVGSLLMFQQVMADPDVTRHVGESVENATAVLAGYGCPGCAFPDRFRRVLRIATKGLSHASQVSLGKMADEDHVPLTLEPKEVSIVHPAIAALLKFFAFDHLPPHLQEISRPFGELARVVADRAPQNPETTVALRKLLEAKDCAVRAVLPA